MNTRLVDPKILANSRLIEVRNLTTHFFTRDGVIRAVDKISFNIEPGESLGLVGESGSGKSVTGRSLVRLVPPPGRIVDGEIFFKGQDICNMDEEKLRNIRGKEISLIQQDPVASLNPTFKVKDQIKDVLKLHKGLTGKRAEEEAVHMMKTVGIPDPTGVLNKYPYQLSGGMCQRIMIEMAFICRPSLVIADEPTTSLDVIIQAMIIELMKKLKAETETSILFITHNLALASKFVDKIAVMYAGKIVEAAYTDKLFKSPKHPYTRGLISVVPKFNKTYRKFPILSGSLPDPTNPPKGCRFYPRCKFRKEKCTKNEIPEFEIEKGHRVTCLLFEKN